MIHFESTKPGSTEKRKRELLLQTVLGHMTSLGSVSRSLNQARIQAEFFGYCSSRYTHPSSVRHS